MTGTLFRYFFLRQTQTIIQFAVGLLAIIFVVDVTELSRRIPVSADFSFGQTALLSLMRIPTIAQVTIPFIVLFASMTTLMSLNRRYELVVARASGVSAWQFLAPLATVSFLVGVLAVTVINPLAASAMQTAENWEVNAGIRNRTDGRFDGPPWMRQSTEEGETIIGAQSTALNGQVLGNPSFMRIDDSGVMIERLDAVRARLSDGEWILTDVRRFRPGQPEEKLEQATVATSLTPAFVRESLSSPSTVPFFELGRKIEATRSFGLSSSGYRMEYQSLISLPVLLVAMTLIAAVVSLRFVRFGQSASVIAGGVAAGFMLYVVTVLIKKFGSVGAVSPVAAAWLPIVVALAFGITVLLHREDG